MKKIIILLVAIATLGLSSFGQSPEGFKYQAVIRDAGSKLINEAVGIRMTIQQGSIGETVVYTETFATTTNDYGLVNLEIGTGTTTDDFAVIDWSSGPYFIETAVDVTGGTSYAIMGTSQLMSVPYALYAKSSGSSIPGPQGPQGLTGAQGPEGKDGAGGVTTAGTNITITGAGTTASPYVVSETGGSSSGDMKYWNGSDWVIIAATSNEGATLKMINGVPTWSGGTPPTVTSTTGKVWMDRNLGADQVATSSTDTSSYGNLYQWGRGTDGHEILSSDTNSILSNSNIPGHNNFIVTNGYDWLSSENDNLWQGVSGTNNPCPSGFRLPTEVEWEAERATWSSDDADGAFSSQLKLPVAGLRNNSNGSIVGAGENGLYWSSTVNNSPSYSQVLYFSANAFTSHFYRSRGISVRCIMD